MTIFRRIQTATNAYLSDIQSEIEDMRQVELGKLDVEADSISGDAAKSMDEQRTELEGRMTAGSSSSRKGTPRTARFARTAIPAGNPLP